MSRFIAVVFLSLAAVSAQAAQTWIVIGDSILSDVPQGNSAQSALHLVAAERNIFFKSLSSPGASLGSADYTGFNSQQTVAAMRRIDGMFNYYQGVVIQAGTNDFGRGLPWSDTVTSLRRILDEVRLDGKKALMLDPIWRADEDVANSQGNTLNTYRYFMNIVCTQEYADVCKIAPRSGTVLGTSAGSAYYDANEVAAGTQLHPNAQGHRHLANWIEAYGAAAGYF